MRALFKIGSFADRVPASIQAESELRLRARNSTPALISTLPPNPTTPLTTKCLHYFLKSSPANSVSLLLLRLIDRTLLTASIAAEPMLPFMVAGAVVLYAINAGANAMMQCE